MLSMLSRPPLYSRSETFSVGLYCGKITQILANTMTTKKKPIDYKTKLHGGLSNLN